MVIKLFKNLAEKVFSASSEVGSQNSVENESLLVNEIDNSSNLSAQDLSNLSATASDVVAAYKIFLKRLPESMDVTNSRVGLDTNKLLLAFFCSDEFLHYDQNRELVLKLSKQVQENNLASSEE
jgi:hypothetical protein